MQYLGPSRLQMLRNPSESLGLYFSPGANRRSSSFLQPLLSSSWPFFWQRSHVEHDDGLLAFGGHSRYPESKKISSPPSPSSPPPPPPSPPLLYRMHLLSSQCPINPPIHLLLTSARLTLKQILSVLSLAPPPVGRCTELQQSDIQTV